MYVNRRVVVRNYLEYFLLKPRIEMGIEVDLRVQTYQPQDVLDSVFKGQVVKLFKIGFFLVYELCLQIYKVIEVKLIHSRHYLEDQLCVVLDLLELRTDLIDLRCVSFCLYVVPFELQL